MILRTLFLSASETRSLALGNHYYVGACIERMLDLKLFHCVAIATDGDSRSGARAGHCNTVAAALAAAFKSLISM